MQDCSLSYPLAMYCEKWPKMTKNDHVHEVGKVQKNNATFIFWGVFGKLNISLLFLPFTSEVLF